MIKLIVMQPTSFCNINCSYCYLSNRNIAGTMAESTLETTIKKILNSKKLVDNKAELLWHAGEPMTAGIEFYKKSIELIKKHNVYNRDIDHAIQTNGTLINNKWCEFFLENNFNVGLSIDGPKELHDQHRKSRDNKGTFDKTYRGINFLKNHKIPLRGLFVVTYNSLDKAEEIFNFFLDNGFSWIGFNVETIVASNTTTSVSTKNKQEVLEKYQNFISTLFDLWQKNKDKIIIREFDHISQIFKKKLASKEYVYTPTESEPFTIITISKYGHISTNCPELADGYEGDPNAFSIGNINYMNSIDEIEHSTKRKEIYANICGGIELCKKSCAYFDLCGGASPSAKMYEHKTFLATETSNCLLYKKVVINVVLEKLKHLQTQNQNILK